MNLGIVADEIDRDFAKAVEIGTSLGIRRYEIRNLPSGRAPVCSELDLKLVETIAAENDVTITALSPGLFKYTDTAEAFRREMSDVYPKAAELAHRWGLPGLITFGFHKPGAEEANAWSLAAGEVPSQVIDWLSEAAARAASDGLLLMIEPEPICWADTSRGAGAMIAKTGSASLRINYDPGNVAWFEQRDPLDEFAEAAKWIANVHVKDLLPSTDRSIRPTFVPAGEGMIDFVRHFEALRQAGYTGPISLEPHMDGKPDTIRRCKEAAEKSYEGHS